MKSVGIICEYNPFHNGHIYHINKIKEMFPDSVIILVMSGSFTQRGDASIINKWNKTKIALNHNIDLVIELPFIFTNQSADTFAFGACSILNYLKVDYLVFGSESDNIDYIKDIVNIEDDKKYQEKVKELLDNGINYPTALSKALKDFNINLSDSSNDLLGISYVKALKKLNSKITPITIKRTNNYNDKTLTKYITSATSIRENINKRNIKKYIPKDTYKCLKEKKYFIEDYYQLLKYKIMSEINDLNKYNDVNEGIENRIKKVIYESNSYDELIMNIKSKRYTYSKIKRILLNILVGFTKEDKEKNKEISYIRVLGFNKNGKNYLNKIKKECNVPIYTNFNKDLEYELKVTSIYDESLIKEEIKNIIICD